MNPKTNYMLHLGLQYLFFPTGFWEICGELHLCPSRGVRGHAPLKGNNVLFNVKFINLVHFESIFSVQIEQRNTLLVVKWFLSLHY